MRTFAPGKLVLTGAYAVLEGAPAVAVAVSRGAFADSSRPGLVATPEVQAAIGGRTPPHTDASAMFAHAALRGVPGAGTRKLGLGASAAILVASLAAIEADAGADPSSPDVREKLFSAAREAHARAQSGGSGVDVAASVYGGAIRYVIGRPVQRVTLPRGLEVHVFACSTSARTSELRAEVDRVAATSPSLHRACMDDLVTIANDAAEAVEAGNAGGFVECLRRTARALARLGASAGVGIVPSGFDALETIAARDDAAFLVSGAGGGDVAVYIGPSGPSPTFMERAHALGLFALDLSIDHKGVRIAPVASVSTAATLSAPDQR